MTMGVFAKYEKQAWPYQFRVKMIAHHIQGGVPSNPAVIEGWLKSKLAAKDDLLRQMVAEVMVEREVSAEQAVNEVILKSLNGFRRNGMGLYVGGYQVKAAIKEAASVARAADKIPARFGTTNKGVQGFVAEHIFVIEDAIQLGVSEPDGIDQSFVHSTGPQGPQHSIRYNEYVEKAELEFHVETDYKFSDKEWAMIWLTGERQGIGAARSQGNGRYEILEWEPN